MRSLAAEACGVGLWLAGFMGIGTKTGRSSYS